MIRKALILATLAGIGTLFALPAPAQQDHDRKPALMQKKLEQAQRILIGLANEDYEAIAKGAKAMNTLTALEEWFRADTPEYQTQLKTFRFANQELIRLADEENIDGAALAYMQLTLCCVNCHKQIRAH